MIKRVAEFVKTAQSIVIEDSAGNVKQNSPMSKNPQFVVVAGDVVMIDRRDIVTAQTTAATIQTSSDGGATWSDSTTIVWQAHTKVVKHTVV